jgi:hypothetical protein
VVDVIPVPMAVDASGNRMPVAQAFVSPPPVPIQDARPPDASSLPVIPQSVLDKATMLAHQQIDAGIAPSQAAASAAATVASNPSVAVLPVPTLDHVDQATAIAVKQVAAGATPQAAASNAAAQVSDMETFPTISVQEGIEADPIRREDVAPPAAPPPSTVYDLYVEGVKAATAYAVSDIAQDADALTKIGDRFEIDVNGVSTGLKIKTVSGPISVPDSDAAAVRAMSPAQVQDAVKQASTSVPPPASGGGGIWAWVLGGGAAAAYAIAKMKGA